MPRILRPLLFGLLLLSVSNQVSAEDAYKVVAVSNGTNRLSLGGHDAMLIRAWRENFNAHGFDVISIFVRDGVGDRGNGPVSTVLDGAG